MDAKIHSDLRVLEIDIGGTLIIPAEGLNELGKDITKPLGLTMWASKVETDNHQW